MADSHVCKLVGLHTHCPVPAGGQQVCCGPPRLCTERLVAVSCCCCVPAGLQDAKDERVTDLHSLVVLPDGSLMWSSCDSPAPSKQMPQGVRHRLALLGP